MRSIKDSESRKEKLQYELSLIQQQEEKELVKKHYPKIKQKYEGKYFKCDNGFNDDERWPLYTKVVEIKPEDVYDTRGNGVTSHFTGWQFEVTSKGNISIESVYMGYVHGIGKEISEKEFNAAWNKMVDRMDSLNN